jgi:hypothetical protein
VQSELIFISAKSIMVALFAGLQGSSAKPAPARQRNMTKTSTNNSKKKKTDDRELKGAATLQKKSSKRRLQRWLDNMPLRSAQSRRKRGLRNWLQLGRSKSCNATLQPHKNLTTQAI